LFRTIYIRCVCYTHPHPIFMHLFSLQVWVRQVESNEEAETFQELPHLLRGEVAWAATSRALRRVDLLSGLNDSALRLLCNKMIPRKYAAGHNLAEEGTAADRCWVLVEGEVAAIYRGQQIDPFHAPRMLAESVLLQDMDDAMCLYPATLRTLTPCTMWMMRWGDLQSLMLSRPKLRAYLSERAMRSLREAAMKFPQHWAGYAFAQSYAVGRQGPTSGTALTAVGKEEEEEEERSGREDEGQAVAEPAEQPAKKRGGAPSDGGRSATAAMASGQELLYTELQALRQDVSALRLMLARQR
jgi:CRP-like cAMP-binding protein